ncbi:MAG: FAD-dependent oxidoreductase [Pseudorhodoplanes sp.]|nr:FAD-dependent oxidoreductase [Pseudorhodoplanes sp.]
MRDTLLLGFGLEFHELYDLAGLEKVDRAFLTSLGKADAALRERLLAARSAPAALDRKAEAELLVALAPHLEDFIGALFGIAEPVRRLQAQHNALAPLYSVKRLFVQRRAAKGKNAESLAALDDADALAQELASLFGEPLSELAFARDVAEWMDDEVRYSSELELAAKYAAWAALTQEGRRRHGDGILFKIPHKTEHANLIPLKRITTDGIALLEAPDGHRREREGFGLTDIGTDLAGALHQANYCIWCHNQEKDSCSKGLRDRKTGSYEKSVFGVTLAGCPLDERISEMNLVKSQGYSIGALAVVAVNNPVCAATGHRICNDCMKACIYQKQEPVDIPQIETRTLKDVLALPWGFEIYGLLTRWNPLNIRRPLPRPASGYKVLVVGLGPAGFTLAHHLMNDGHTVVAVDGLKIEPLPQSLSGVDGGGMRAAYRPIRDVSEIYEDLNERIMAGFGGVAEYGITVRWNKNFLKVVRLLLERRSSFAMYGGVRFGGTLTVDDAFAMGFDHIALCLGAGKPTFVAMKNGLAPGVRQASDFLMALQLTGAARADSIANLTVRLPVVVIGGGLTAIDTATEALAYYPVQVEKFLGRYERLLAARGKDVIQWRDDEAAIVEEFVKHGRALRAERAAAKEEGRPPQISALLDSWGGATVIYRRRLIDAPSYTLNHEEVDKAMQEGIRFAECLAPEAVLLDAHGHAERIRLARTDAGAGSDPGRPSVTLPDKTILVAAGTQPNTVVSREDPVHFELDGRYFQAVDENGAKVSPERIAKPQSAQVLMNHGPDGRAISFFGDLHPSFAGNVVKAMASATRGYPVITRMLSHRPPNAVAATDLMQRLNKELRATVQAVHRLTPTILEIVIHAPQAARSFKPGQFFRLQNFDTLAPKIAGTKLTMEGLALTGAWVDRSRGLISTIVLEMGGSSNLCASLRPGEPVILMGPTGTPTEILPGQTYTLVGGGLGNAVLFSIGQAARQMGSKVLYFAGYKKLEDRYKVEQIEQAADVVVWCSDQAPGFTPTRPQDRAFVGNIVRAMEAYALGKLGDPALPLAKADRLVVIGSDAMMAAVARARHDALKDHLNPRHVAIGSINSPMQCMMKEICGQCLQLHRDPITQEETVVFSCFNQDQPLDCVDFPVLRARLGQNSAQEKLTRNWIEYCLE